ncbi:hypothetical protein LEMLEM_LOCUS5493 [Lemmus lemmus]
MWGKVCRQLHPKEPSAPSHRGPPIHVQALPHDLHTGLSPSLPHQEEALRR